MRLHTIEIEKLANTKCFSIIEISLFSLTKKKKKKNSSLTSNKENSLSHLRYLSRELQGSFYRRSIGVQNAFIVEGVFRGSGVFVFEKLAGGRGEEDRKSEPLKSWRRRNLARFHKTSFKALSSPLSLLLLVIVTRRGGDVFDCDQWTSSPSWQRPSGSPIEKSCGEFPSPFALPTR